MKGIIISGIRIPQIPLAVRNHFQANWEMLSNDPQTLDLIQGYQIPFKEVLNQDKLPNQQSLDQKKLHLQRRVPFPKLPIVRKSSKQSLFSPKEGRWETSSDKSESSKQICSLPTLQDGRFIA